MEIRSIWQKCRKVVPAVAVGVGSMAVATQASAAVGSSLIDFGQIATDMLPLMGTAITAAAGIGVVVMAARLCWRFFKSFAKG